MAVPRCRRIHRRLRSPAYTNFGLTLNMPSAAQQTLGALVDGPPRLRRTGTRLAIASEGATIPPGSHVYLGNCRAAEAVGLDTSNLRGNGYLVKTVGADLYIAGKDAAGDPLDMSTHAGTLFGVYDILENNMSVRWLWPGKLGEVIPARRDISLPALNASVEPHGPGTSHDPC